MKSKWARSKKKLDKEIEDALGALKTVHKEPTGMSYEAWIYPKVWELTLATLSDEELVRFNRYLPTSDKICVRQQ